MGMDASLYKLITQSTGSNIPLKSMYRRQFKLEKIHRCAKVSQKIYAVGFF